MIGKCYGRSSVRNKEKRSSSLLFILYRFNLLKLKTWLREVTGRLCGTFAFWLKRTIAHDCRVEMWNWNTMVRRRASETVFPQLPIYEAACVNASNARLGVLWNEGVYLELYGLIRDVLGSIDTFGILWTAKTKIFLSEKENFWSFFSKSYNFLNLKWTWVDSHRKNGANRSLL